VFTDDELNLKLKSLGPCWISDNISFNEFLDIVNSTIKKSKNKDDLFVAQFFMNQKKTAGIGNYVVSEVFYETMLWPFAKMTDLNEDDWFRVYKAIKNIIGSSYLAQKNYLKSKFGIIDDDSNDIGDDDNDYAYGDNHIFSFKVYSRSICPKGFKIKREEGPHSRTIHWVPELQKRHKI
jgi:formamidopyrimidine-DNA glycosylase